jgi:transcription elongation factor GreA
MFISPPAMLLRMSDTVKMTQDAHDRLEEKVQQLEGEARRDAAEKIGTARAEGDLKENAEYHAAKDDAAMLEAKIARIREQLRAAVIVEAADGDAAGMGSTVTYEDDGKKIEFTLVPASEADPGKGRLSIDSPMGSALTGAQAGDTRSLETPRGPRDVRIIAIENS